MDIVQVFQCLQSSFFHSGHSSLKQSTREQQLSTRWKLMSGPIMYNKNPVASYILFIIILAFLISWDFHKAHIQIIPLCNIWPLSLILGRVSSQLLELKFNTFLILSISCFKDTLFHWFQDTKTNIYYELGVSTTTPKVPVFLFEDEAGFAFGIETFEEFTSGVPDATKFTVPALCREKPAWFHGNTPARNYSGISAFERLIPQFNV